MVVLLDENTPRENQMEILEEIRTIADINGDITVAMSQISQGGIKQSRIDKSKDTVKDEDISVWAKNQAGLIRRKQLALNNLQKRETELDEDFWVNLALDGVVIVAGGVLFFVPAVGPAVSIPLTAGRIALTGQRLGALLMATGAVESGLDVWSYVFGEEERVLSFVSDIAFRDVLTRELFSILSSVNQSDRYLAINLLKNASNEETLISDLLNIMQDERRSAEVKRSAIRALRAISNMDEGLRGEVISALRYVIDESQIPSLKETSVSVLGELGEGMNEVAEYLFDIGDDTNNSDELRLIALIELGRSEDYFPISIEELAYWLADRDNENKPFFIQPEISDSFRDSLLSAKKWEFSENHIIVLKEFIRSGILNAELKLRFSETLLSWDGGSENKALLRKAYSNPAKDIGLYVKDDLFGENLFEENYVASQFLTIEISVLENVKDSKRTLREIELIVKKLKRDYPNQIESAKKLEEIVNSYKKILKAIEN